MEKHFKLLGLQAKDKVTGFSGVISTLSFDLYGCIQAAITPPVNKDGKLQDGTWFDVTRLEILSESPVMELPDYNIGYKSHASEEKKEYVSDGKKGSAVKPLPKH